MHSHLEFIKNNVDDADRTKFTTLEYEKFKRVVDYMENTTYDNDTLSEARRNFYNWFTEHDRRRNVSLTNTFPELQDFYVICKNT
jgi:hypothetical protein